jgi:hypothetical protein
MSRPRRDPVADDRGAVVLRPSPTVSFLGLASPALLIVLGLVGVIGGGLATPGGVVLVVGLVVLGLVAWEVPWRCRIDADGVHRRSLVRREDVAWDDVVAFERGGRRRGGGLIVRTIRGTRRALSDATERPDQWDALRMLVSDHAPGVAVPPPPRGHPFADRDR